MEAGEALLLLPFWRWYARVCKGVGGSGGGLALRALREVLHR